MRLNDCHNRAQIDARNLKENYMGMYHHVTKMYNDISWVPISGIFAHIHERLNISIPFKLIGEEMTVVNAKKFYCIIKGELNWVIAGWRKSGNGSMNLEVATSISPHMSSNEIISDDTKGKFIQYLHVGYFWGLSEKCGLTDSVSQNCSRIGFSSTDSSMHGQ
jgi:hypothetical protein